MIGEKYQPKADIWESLMKWKGGTEKDYNVPWLCSIKRTCRNTCNQGDSLYGYSQQTQTG